jgi:hypothetical protein
LDSHVISFNFCLIPITLALIWSVLCY